MRTANLSNEGIEKEVLIFSNTSETESSIDLVFKQFLTHNGYLQCIRHCKFLVVCQGGVAEQLIDLSIKNINRTSANLFNCPDVAS